MLDEYLIKNLSYRQKWLNGRFKAFTFDPIVHSIETNAAIDVRECINKIWEEDPLICEQCAHQKTHIAPFFDSNNRPLG